METLYHGTQEWRADCIDQEGFIGGELDDCTVGTHVEGGVVYLADTVEEASEYGDVVFVVHLEGIEVTSYDHPDTGRHYIAKSDDLNDQAWWERI